MTSTRLLRQFLPVLLLTISSMASATTQDKQKAFIDNMVREHGFSADSLNETLSLAALKESILKAIARPAEKRLTWTEYQKIFLIPVRIEGGVKFWKENIDALEKAYEKFGVPPEIITAIIGVETLYGKRTGGYRVLDALTTLGFHYPPRSKFFLSELSHFLRLAREENIDPTMPTGSYAGAMGKPQFIPSSYRHYAIDFDGDGKRDIWNNNIDVIGSVANYFSLHGWQKDLPVSVPVVGVNDSHQALIDAGMKPALSVGQMRKAGIIVDPRIAPETRSSLVELKRSTGQEYWAGLDNFYVITRYNHSNMYAMAVYQLSQEIRHAYQALAK